MNGKERSFSEVGDTLRYFNSMASSHSWCCSEFYQESANSSILKHLVSPALETIYNDQQPNSDITSLNSEVIYMSDVRASTVKGPNEACSGNGRHLLSPPPPLRSKENRCNMKKQPVSILLTAPSDIEFSKTCINEESQVLSDPSLIMTSAGRSFETSTFEATRRASDDCRYYSSAINHNNLQVVHLTDNPFLQYREASDGVLALRADRERQRRHSIEPSSSKSSKTLKMWIQSFQHQNRKEGCHSLENFNLEKKERCRPQPLVPEVVVSHHSSENLRMETETEDTIRQELANRAHMANTVQKYLILKDSTPLKDKLFTAGLLALTMLGILVLFWYQNFGPGFSAFKNH